MKDINCLTWVKRENFKNMYDSVYELIFEAGVSGKLNEKQHFNAGGNLCVPKKMFGLASQYYMLHLDCVLFVDEFGSITKQKHDLYLGVNLIFIPVEEYYEGLNGATMNLNFTVLCFTEATCNPVLCAIILKSNQNI